MKKMHRLTSVLLAAALLLTLVTGCGAKATSAGGAKGTTLTIGLASDITSLDPAFAYDFTTNPVVNQITEGLLIFDENNKIQPLLAKEWKMVDDTTYVYTIRNDVKFSDGTPMTMDDVLFSLERTKNPDTASYLGWMYDSVESITKTGDWEVTVKLKQPDATWQYIFATTAGHIISKAYYEAHKDNFGTAEGGVMGTGAYKYVSWKSGKEVVLTRNENYWDTSKKIDITDVVYKIIPEDTTRVTALQTNQIDFSADPPLDMLQTLRDSGKVELSASDTMGLSYLAFNTQKAPFNDANVRKAIYHAINFQPLYDNIIKEAGKPASTMPMGPALFTIEPERWTEYASKAPKYEYNLDKAKEYLAKSSVANGFDCTVLMTESALSYAKGLAVQEALKPLNINVTLQKLGADEHTAYQFGNKMTADGIRDYDMIIAGWEADYPDPCGNMIPLYASSNAGEGGANAAAYKNAEVDKLLDAQLVSTNPTERVDLMLKALDIITQDVPYIFFEYPVKNSAINKKFSGFTMNASWLWNLRVLNFHPAEAAK